MAGHDFANHAGLDAAAASPSGALGKRRRSASPHAVQPEHMGPAGVAAVTSTGADDGGGRRSSRRRRVHVDRSDDMVR